MSLCPERLTGINDANQQGGGGVVAHAGAVKLGAIPAGSMRWKLAFTSHEAGQRWKRQAAGDAAVVHPHAALRIRSCLRGARRHCCPATCKVHAAATCAQRLAVRSPIVHHSWVALHLVAAAAAGGSHAGQEGMPAEPRALLPDADNRLAASDSCQATCPRPCTIFQQQAVCPPGSVESGELV